MKLTNAQEVKKWLRTLPLVKKELELKIQFYKELADDFGKLPGGSDERAGLYLNKIDELKKRIDTIVSDTERLFKLLDEDERLIMTARYIKLIRWDYIGFHVFYSRRQAIRIHDRAILKLVGQTVGEE